MACAMLPSNHNPRSHVNITDKKMTAVFPTATVSQALALVSAEAIYSEPVFDMHGHTVKGKTLLRDSSTASHLAIVSDSYRVVQTAAALAPLDVLVSQGKASIAGVAKLSGGRRVVLQARMGNAADIDGKGDLVQNYLTFSVSHDGESAVRVYVTPRRIVCTNALVFAHPAISMRHDWARGSEERYAAEVYRESGEAFDTFADISRAMLSTHVSDAQVNDALARIFPGDSERAANTRARAATLACEGIGQTASNRSTVWGIYAGVTELLTERGQIVGSAQSRAWETVSAMVAS